MRMVLTCVAGALLCAASGCATDGGDVVSLTFDQPMGLMPALSGFHATNATAISDATGVVTFEATSSEGRLTMAVQGPLVADSSKPISLADEHNFVSFDVSTGGWSSNGGSVIVDGVSPYRLRLQAVPMLKGAGTVAGTFVINGSGTFK
jgi:hypothetical protein